MSRYYTVWDEKGKPHTRRAQSRVAAARIFAKAHRVWFSEFENVTFVRTLSRINHEIVERCLQVTTAAYEGY